MSERHRLRLHEMDLVVAAWAESASGPGWANSPLWVLILERERGRYRVECIQPQDQTAEMLALYKFSALAHGEMTGAVRRDAIKARKERAA